jgi:hypothetical protein
MNQARKWRVAGVAILTAGREYLRHRPQRNVERFRGVLSTVGGVVVVGSAIGGEQRVAIPAGDMLYVFGP